MVPDIPTDELPLYLQEQPARSGASIVSFGGGHGLYAALRALRLLTQDLTAVVTVADDGGSSGRLREELGGLPPGDLRMALAALCDDGEWGRTWRDIIQLRFSSTGPLNDHAVGNLLIAALWQKFGDHVKGLDWMARLLRAHGRVLPMSSVPLTIEADVVEPDGESRIVRGQAQLAGTRGRVESVRLLPPAPGARSETIAAVDAADVLNLGPGSWYTSVMPHLLVPELRDAVYRSDAVKTLTLNLPGATKETRGLSLADHLRGLHDHAPSLTIDYVIVDSAAAAAEPGLAGAAHELFGATLWRQAVSAQRPGQHDSLKLAACYRDILVSAGLTVDEQW